MKLYRAAIVRIGCLLLLPLVFKFMQARLSAIAGFDGLSVGDAKICRKWQTAHFSYADMVCVSYSAAVLERPRQTGQVARLTERAKEDRQVQIDYLLTLEIDDAFRNFKISACGETRFSR